MNMISSRNLISNLIFKVINEKQFHCLPELIELLNKHQNLLMNILDNDPMNASDKNLLLHSSKEAIHIVGIAQKVTLSSDFIQEAIIISDMFKLNEMTAVELLMSGEAEKSSNPNITRGLMAVLSYYESQKSIVDSLRLLLQAKLILLEESTASIEVVNFIEYYLDKLFNGGLFNYILNKIQAMDFNVEVNILESQRALGPPNHRRQFYTLFKHIKMTLCECIMLRSYKTPLNRSNTLQLMDLIQRLYGDNDIEVKKEELIIGDDTFSKSVDQCLVYLLISLISSMNPVINGNNVLNYSKECFNHPFFSDEEYQKGIDVILKDNMTKSEFNVVSDNDVQNIVHNIDRILYLSWIISLQKVSQLRRENNINQLSTSFGDYDDFIDVEVLHMDSESIFDCFNFLIKIIDIYGFHEENIWVKCLHDLITDFIIYMPKMLKDLRIESMRMKSNVTYYSSLLELIGRLYDGAHKFCDLLVLEPNLLLESLVLEFWSPQEIVNYSDSSTLLAFEDNFKCWNIKSNDSFKQAVLFKFIRDSGDLIDNPDIFISYVFMLKGLCSSDQISVYIYSLLNNNQISHQPSRLTWEWFSNSLQKHAHFLMSTPNTLHTMATEELNGLLVVLGLIKRVSQQSKVVCTSMIENESLMLVRNIIMLLSCGVPEILKAELINCLAVFCVNGLAAKSIWQGLETHNIISRHLYPMKCSIFIELDEIEPKSQEFFITRAFINLLSSEVTYIVSDFSLFEPLMTSFDNVNQTVITSNIQFTTLDNFTNVLHMVMDTVFLKYAIRTYKNVEEKYVICESFLKLCCNSVDMFMTKVCNMKVTKGKLSWCQYDPGFFIINQLLNDSLFFKTIISIINSGYEEINYCLYNINYGNTTLSRDAIDSLQNSIYYAMSLLYTILYNETFLIQLIRELNSKSKNEEANRCYTRMSRFKNGIPQELSRLLMSSNNTQYFLPNLIKYISIVNECEKLCRKALSILNICVNMIEPHSNIILMLTNKNVIADDVLPLFVNCIDKYGDIDFNVVETLENRGIGSFFFSEFSPDSPRTLVLKLFITSLKKSNPNLSHYLLGFSCDSIDSLKRTSLQEAGVGDCPKTCLHSILNLIQRLSLEILRSPCFDNPETISNQLTSFTINMMDLCLALKIIYTLASDHNTSAIVLRFIRSNYQLIINQMDLLSFKTIKIERFPELQALFWNQKSWLLKIIAIEIRQCTATQQKLYVVKLLKVLFGEDTFEINNESIFNKFYSEENKEPFECEGLIYELLDDMNISESEDIIDFSRGTQRFRSEILKEYLSQCVEENSYTGLKLMKADRLRQLILADIIGTVEEEQFLYIMTDIDALCNSIEKYNLNEILMTFGKFNMLDGWRQVVEIAMVSECSGEECVEVTVKAKKVCNILIKVMKKVLISTTPSALVAPLSTLCLVMTAVFGAMFLPPKDYSLISSKYLSESDLVQTHKFSLLNTGQLDYQLRCLMALTTDCILKINMKHQNTRVKFYASMTYLLQIALKSDNNKCAAIENSFISLYSVIFDRSLYPTLCRDAVSGNIHLSLSSLTLLDIIANIDTDPKDLVTYLVDNGYLQHLIDSLVKDCINLFSNMKQDFGDNCSTIPYYLYQSKMSLLCKLATQSKGSNVLVQYGVMSRLSKCDVFRVCPAENRLLNMYYDSDSENESQDSLLSFHANILSLAVELGSTILSTQDIDKSDSIREVNMFVGEFIDSLCAPFQSSTSVLNSCVTKEMIHISSIFQLLSSAILNNESVHQEGYYYRTLEKIKTASSQMLDCLLGVLSVTVHGVDGTMQYLLQIELMYKLLLVVTAIVSTGSRDYHKLLFFSNNIEGVLSFHNNCNASVKKVCQRMFSGDKPPLSMVIIMLYKIQDCIIDIERKMNRLIEKISMKDKAMNLSLGEVEQNLEKMSTDQLKMLWSSIFESNFSTLDHISVEYMDSDLSTKTDFIKDLLLIFKRMTSILSNLTSSLECCTFLIWHHICAYKSTSAVNQFSENLHPLQRLQIIEQETKKELILSRNNISKNTDFLSSMAKCLDEEFLGKLQKCLEELCKKDETSFSRIIIHQLIRMLKFT